MPESSPPVNDPNPRPTGLSRVKGVVILAATTTAIAVAGALGARYFVYRQLGPTVDDTLTTLLGRPLITGEVKAFTLRGITIDGATVPPTAADGSYATVDTIRVGFNPIQLVNRLARDRTVPITLTLIEPTVYAEQDASGEWVVADIDIADEEGPVTVAVDRVQIRDARVVASAYPSPFSSPWQNDGFWDTVASASADGAAPLVLNDVDGVLNIREENRYVGFDVLATLLGGGDLDLSGEIDTLEQAVQTVVQSRGLQVNQFGALLASQVPQLDVVGGRVDANLAIDYRPDRLPQVNGTARLQDGEATLAELPETANLNALLRFDQQDIHLEETRLTLGDVVLTSAGRINLETGYDLTAQLQPVTLAALQAIANVELPVMATGELGAELRLSGPLDQPVAAGVVQTTAPLRIDQIDVDRARARFTATPQQVMLDDLSILPALGGAIAGSGRVDLDAGSVAIDLSADGLPSDAVAARYGASLPPDYRVGDLDADIEITGPFADLQAIARWQLPAATYPGAGEVRYRGSRIALQSTEFSVEGGRVTADGAVDLAAGTWQAAVDAVGVTIDRFADQADGALTAALELGGRLDTLDPSAIQFAGEATLADARIRAAADAPLLLERGDWRTRFRWTGTGLDLDQLSAPGIEASGRIGARLDQGVQLGEVDLAVLAQGLDLATAAAFLPPQVQEQLQIQGLATFDGRITGVASRPQAAGQLQLDGLGVNAVSFASLAGPVAVSLTGGTIDLTDVTGGSARLSATVDERYLPAQFALRNAMFDIEGQTVGDQLSATVRDLNLAALGINPLPDQGPGDLQGTVTANLTANLADLSNPSLQAAIAVAKPGLGYIVADQFQGRISYRDRQARLSAGELRLGESRYRLGGEVLLRPNDPQFQAQIAIEQGKLQDIVTALQWVDVTDIQRGFLPPDYGSAADLATVERGEPEAELLQQMLLAVKAAGEGQVETDRLNAAVLPSLTALVGTLTGQASVSGSLQSGTYAEFNLDGEDIAWGRYDEPTRFSVDGSAVATGGFEDVTLTLDPVDVYYGDGRVNLVATLNPERSSGLLEVSDVPVGLIKEFVAVPVDLDGQIHASARFGGALANPVVNAEVDVQDPSLNGTPFEAARVDFRYDNATLNFDGAVALEDAERLTLVGEVPYRLPFVTAEPESDRLIVDANLRNDGLALLSLLTQDQARWEGGEGEVDLRITGTLDQPQVLGTARFENGVISSPQLSRPVTDITGNATFNLDTVNVETLTASLGDGSMTASGTLPLLVPTGDSSNITVAIDRLPVTVQNLFRATVHGEVAIAGAALSPIVSGELDIARGRVNATRLTGGGAAPSTELAVGVQSGPSFLNQVTFDNFVVALDDSLRITGQPLFDLATIGEVTVNGTAANPRPSGTLTLTSGWINVYATEFLLDRSRPNTVTFVPSQGLDPTLDVHMVARIRQVQRTPVPPSSPFATAEVLDQSTVPTFGGLNTVVVYADAEGRASTLTQSTDNITLTSDPSRSRQQLLALIGGSVVDSVASGNVAVAAASFVGSGYLANVGSQIAETLGLSEFSIFPTTSISDDAKFPVVIGVEAAVDITGDLSFSILEVIDGESSPQFGLRYQITDDIRMRASSDLNDDSRGILEYERDF